MPTKRVRTSRKRNSPFVEGRLHYLRTGELADKFITQHSLARPSLQALWKRHGATIIRDHIRQYPCTRPAGWWLHDAPDEYRKVVAGRGRGEHGPTPADGKLWDHVQCFERIDANNPPQVESEAAFLLRHGMLTPAEVRHLYDHPELLRPVVCLPFDPGYRYDWKRGE